MIDDFNRRQFFRAVLAIFLSLLATAITIGFFYGAFRMMTGQFGVDHWNRWIPYLVAGVLLVVFYSGWDLWRRGFGHPELSESDFSYSFDNSVGGGMRANLAVIEERVYGYVFSQIALAAPLQLLKAVNLLRSRIPSERNLESSLGELLQTIESKGKWHSIADYRGRETDIMYLVRMGKIDFSPRRGSLRPKS